MSNEGKGATARERALAALALRERQGLVKVRRVVVDAEGTPTGEVWEREGPPGAMGPYVQVSPPNEGES